MRVAGGIVCVIVFRDLTLRVCYRGVEFLYNYRAISLTGFVFYWLWQFTTVRTT